MNRKIEGLINSFGELTPERHSEKVKEFTTIYETEGEDSLDGQGIIEATKASLAYGTSAILGLFSIQGVITGFQDGNPTEITAGTLGLAIAIKMAQTAVRTFDNARIALEVDKNQFQKAEDALLREILDLPPVLPHTQQPKK